MDKQAFEPTGLVPRSIIRTVERFRQQLLPGTEAIAIQEFRISRYQVLVSLRCLATLICAPILVNLLVKTVLLTPTVEHLWNAHQNEIFINSYQEDRALLEMQNFSEKIFFESLLADNPLINEVGVSLQDSQPFGFVEGPLDFETKETPASWGFNGPLGFEPFSTQSVMREAVISCRDPYPQGVRWPPMALPAMQKVIEGASSTTSLIPPRPFIMSPKNSLDNLPQVRKPLNFSLLMKDPSENFWRQWKPKGTGLLGCCIASNSKGPFNTICDTSNILCDETSTSMVSQRKQVLNEETLLEKQFQRRATELAFAYNRESLQAVINLFGDLFTFLTVFLLSLWMKPQIIILKSFLTESIYSLSDTSKSFLLILCTDLLVGFHSPRGWEIAIESLLKHFGLPENQDFIFLFVAAFPVFLDTIFKYWIFRYLNKISPSTVATYHNMIE